MFQAKSNPCPRSRPGTRSSYRGLYRLREKIVYTKDFTSVGFMFELNFDYANLFKHMPFSHNFLEIKKN